MGFHFHSSTVSDLRTGWRRPESIIPCIEPYSSLDAGRSDSINATGTPLSVRTTSRWAFIARIAFARPGAPLFMAICILGHYVGHVAENDLEVVYAGGCEPAKLPSSAAAAAEA
jgi:hypothetical protein